MSRSQDGAVVALAGLPAPAFSQFASPPFNIYIVQQARVIPCLGTIVPRLSRCLSRPTVSRLQVWNSLETGSKIKILATETRENALLSELSRELYRI